jgi:hypothetical protein
MAQTQEALTGFVRLTPYMCLGNRGEVWVAPGGPKKAFPLVLNVYIYVLERFLFSKLLLHKEFLDFRSLIS